MVYILINSDIQLDWTIFKSRSRDREELRDCLVQAFLVSEGNRWALTPSVDRAERGTVHLTLPKEMNLVPGVYGLKLVWGRNKLPGRHDELLSWRTARSICVSEAENVFAITTDQSSAPDKPQHYAIKTEAATYGRDGLDAWERAIMLGMTTDDEASWTETGVSNVIWSFLGEEGEQQIDGSHLTDALADYAKSEDLNDYVTLDTDQTVTAKKTFSSNDAEPIEIKNTRSASYAAKIPFYVYGEKRGDIGAENGGMAITNAKSGNVLRLNDDGRLVYYGGGFFGWSSEILHKRNWKDVMTFDSVPTSGSTNLVTSGDIKTALDSEAQARALTDTDLQGGIDTERGRAQDVEAGLQADKLDIEGDWYGEEGELPETLIKRTNTTQDNNYSAELQFDGVNFNFVSDVEESGRPMINGEEIAIRPEVNSLRSDVTAINGKIPAQASEQNQLADKAFVNSSVATSTATFRGTYDSLAELQAVVGADENDYGFVIGEDADGNAQYSRYKYVTGTGWVFEYTLNNSSFTAAQWATIESGIVSGDKTKLDALPTAAELETLLAGKLGATETAVAATKLATSRKIWGQLFDGRRDIDGPLIGARGNLRAVVQCVFPYKADIWEKIGSAVVSENNGEVTVSANLDDGVNINISPAIVSNNKYALVIDIKGAEAGSVRLLVGSSTAVDTISYSATYSRHSVFFTASSASSSIILATTANGTSFTVKNAMLLDLTKMFGAGSEPTDYIELPHALGYEGLEELPYIYKINRVVSDALSVGGDLAVKERIVPLTGKLGIDGEIDNADLQRKLNKKITIDETVAFDDNEHSTAIPEVIFKRWWTNQGEYDHFSLEWGTDGLNFVSSEYARPKINGTKIATQYDVSNGLSGKVDKVTGKGLSTEDYTTAEREKLGALPTNSELTTALAGKEETINDLSTIRSGAAAGATAYQKPSGGIPSTDMSSEVQTSLGKADTALQEHQSLSNYYTKPETYAEIAAGVLVEETRAKAAEQANADDIDAIEAKIPAQASAQNQLADKQFVNSSVATATATYRGSYNLVSDLSLTTSATEQQIATALATAIQTADNNDYCFVQVPTADATPAEIARVDRYKYDGSAWVFEFSLNNSGFTAAQWAALNSGITSGLVVKLNGLATVATSGDYRDLNHKPTIGNGILQFVDADGLPAGAFSANQTTDLSIEFQQGSNILIVHSVIDNIHQFTFKTTGLPTTSEVASAIATALASYYTKIEADSLLSSKLGTSETATAAAKLETARTLWGQSFNGTQDVSGNMSGVGSLSMNGVLSGARGVFKNWNQILPQLEAQFGGASTYIGNQGGTVLWDSDHFHITFDAVQASGAYSNNFYRFAIVQNHKYIYIVNYKSDATVAATIGIFPIHSDLMTSAKIFTANSNQFVSTFYYNHVGGTAGYVDVYWHCLIDLTAMFGAGNEPSTPEEFARRLGYASIEDVPCIPYTATPIPLNDAMAVGGDLIVWEKIAPLSGKLKIAGEFKAEGLGTPSVQTISSISDFTGIECIALLDVSNNTSQTIPSDIGLSKPGYTSTLIITNSGTSDITVSIPSAYKSYDGNNISVPAGGLAEMSFLYVNSNLKIVSSRILS